MWGTYTDAIAILETIRSRDYPTSVYMREWKALDRAIAELKRAREDEMRQQDEALESLLCTLEETQIHEG